jgi:hypothetical protein
MTGYRRAILAVERLKVADRRPMRVSNPAIHRDQAGIVGIRRVSTLCCHPPTAASGERNHCAEV